MKRWQKFLFGGILTSSLIVGGCLYAGWSVVDSVLATVTQSSRQSVGIRVYKNYVKKTLIYEAVADRNEDLIKTIEDISILDIDNDPVLTEKVTTGDFVVIPVLGPITDITNYQDIFDQLTIATRYNSNRTKAVILLINSPGGMVSTSDNLYHEVSKLKTHDIKVVTFVNGLLASGSYYIAAASDKIVASPTSFTGSIGVIMQMYNFEGLAGKLGVGIRTIKSSEMKDIGSPFRRMSQEERIVFQRLIDNSYQRFMSVVQEGRGFNDQRIQEVATGEIWDSSAALNLGLIDDVGYMRRAIDVASDLTGISRPSVVKYEKQVGFWDVFSDFSGTSFGNSFFVNPNLDNVVENFLPAPRILYQWIP